MESVATIERQTPRNGAHSSRRTDSRRCSPRLPTPETSWSSKGSLDEQVPRVYARQGPQIHALLSQNVADHDSISTDRANERNMRRDSRHHPVPQSPPYQPADVHRPSLPPLKTILGDAISSPPDTPRTQDAPCQPSPREPSFTALTFKPPSLYPNKKPRTERSLDPSPIIHTKSNLSSPGVPSAPYDPTHGRAARQPSIPYTHATLRAEDGDVRRMSMHQGYQQPQDQISPGTVPYHYERNVRKPPSARSNGFARPEYGSTEPVGFTAGPSPPLMPYHARPPLDRNPSSTHRYAVPLEPNPDRRSSIIAPSDYPTARYESHHGPGSQPYHATSQYSLPLRDDYSPRKVPRYEPRGQEPPEAIAGFNHAGFQDAQAAFFMPSHYDYQQGKTRKRSNLPKQSTEIMKTWFDQNISNPYPSEEQKAIFSNATGISMTQVSNWFINHRRRCPELRDKRDKIRSGGDD